LSSLDWNLDKLGGHGTVRVVVLYKLSACHEIAGICDHFSFSRAIHNMSDSVVSVSVSEESTEFFKIFPEGHQLEVLNPSIRLANSVPMTEKAQNYAKTVFLERHQDPSKVSKLSFPCLLCLWKIMLWFNSRHEVS
jgi:hypothetical protein